jgi:hypothetical protein
MSFRQHVTSPRLLGRVNGTLRVMSSGALTRGAAAAASVGDLSGPRTATRVAYAALALVCVPILLPDEPGDPRRIMNLSR